jgi:hypothetical protein
MANGLTLITASGGAMVLESESIVGIYPTSVGSIVVIEAGDDLVEHEVLETAHEISRRWIDARSLASAMGAT